MSVSIKTLRDIALNIRSAFDSCDRSGWGVLFDEFPNGRCGAAVEILSRYLLDRHGLTPTYVSGTWYPGEARVSSQISPHSDAVFTPGIVFGTRKPLWVTEGVDAYFLAKQMGTSVMLEDHYRRIAPDANTIG